MAVSIGGAAACMQLPLITTPDRVVQLLLIATFASGFGGIGYRRIASEKGWRMGSSWGKPTLDALCLIAILVSFEEARAHFGTWTACAIAAIACVFEFLLTSTLRHRIQVLNGLGITLGNAACIVAAFFHRYR